MLSIVLRDTKCVATELSCPMSYKRKKEIRPNTPVATAVIEMEIHRLYFDSKLFISKSFMNSVSINPYNVHV